MNIHLSLQEKNGHNNYLMGFIFWKCWRVLLKKIKIRMGIWIFQNEDKKKMIGRHQDIRHVDPVFHA